MFARFSLGVLMLVACDKRDEQSRAVSATDTLGATKPDRNTRAEPTGAGGDSDRGGPEAGGSVPEPSKIKGGGDGVGFTHGTNPVATGVTLRSGQPTIEGTFDKETLRRYVRRNFPALRTCYEQRLVARAGLNGTLTASFVIGPDGTVRDAKASGLDAEVESCFAKVIGTIQFPPAKEPADARVTYPFMVRPADD